jgi:predicted dehydrogenase
VRGHYIHTHDAARASLEIQIHGERGALWLQEGRLSFSQRPLEQFGERPVEPVALVDAFGEADLLRDFHAYVTRGVEPGVSARHNLETMAACEMMVRSIGAGRTSTRAELETEQ